MVIQGEYANRLDDISQPDCDNAKHEMSSEPMEVDALVKVADESSDSQLPFSSISKTSAPKVINFDD